MTDTITWTPGAVYADWNEQTYPAEIADQRWNGWAVPRFTRAVAEQIVADQETIQAEYPQDSEIMTWDGDIIEVDRSGMYDDGGVERIPPDDDGMYHIGGWSWTWQVVPVTFQIPVEFFVTVEADRVTKMVVSPLESHPGFFGRRGSVEVEAGILDPETHLWPIVQTHLAETNPTPVHWEE